MTWRPPWKESTGIAGRWLHDKPAAGAKPALRVEILTQGSRMKLAVENVPVWASEKLSVRGDAGLWRSGAAGKVLGLRGDSAAR